MESFRFAGLQFLRDCCGTQAVRCGSVIDRTNRRQCISAGPWHCGNHVLVVDAQIDLPMFDTGSTLFAFCLLGISGVVKHDPVKNKLRIRPIDRFASIIPLFMASVIYIFGYCTTST